MLGWPMLSPVVAREEQGSVILNRKRVHMLDSLSQNIVKTSIDTQRNVFSDVCSSKRHQRLANTSVHIIVSHQPRQLLQSTVLLLSLSHAKKRCPTLWLFTSRLLARGTLHLLYRHVAPILCYRMFSFTTHAFRPPHGPERLRGSYDTSNDRVQGVVSSRAGVNRTSAELSAQQGVCVPVAGTIVHNGREELPDLVRSALFGAATACRDLPAKRRSCCRLA